MAARRMILACRVFSALRFSATDGAIVVAAQKFVVGPTMRSGAPRSRLVLQLDSHGSGRPGALEGGIMRSIIAVAVAVLATAPATAEAAPTVRAAKAETAKLAALQARELDKFTGLEVERYTVGNCYSYTRRVTCSFAIFGTFDGRSFLALGNVEMASRAHYSSSLAMTLGR
jgi:hypothetical protein